MLLSMCSCAPGYFHVDISSIFTVIALDLVKIYNIQLVMHKKYLTCRPESLQECWSACVFMHLGVFLWIYSVFVVFALYLIKDF
jgi:hypothetical protein